MSKETKSKRFISIRLRLFLQVGAIVLIAVMLILALNKWYLSSIYILNQKRTMQYLAEEIDTYDVSAADYSSKIALLEKDNGVTIDVYMSDGTPLYYGAVPTGITGGKIVIRDRHDNPDGSFFEIQENAMSDTQFIVYGKSLKFGGDLEMYSKKNDDRLICRYSHKRNAYNQHTRSLRHACCDIFLLKEIYKAAY